VPVNARDALAVVQHIYACALTPGVGLWDTVVADVADFLGVERASAATVDKSTRRFTLLGVIGFDARTIESAFRRFGVESDPLYRAALPRPAHSTFYDGEALPPLEERRRAPFHGMVGGPENIGHVLAGIVRNDADALVVMAFWRTVDGGGFTPEERETLAWLMPHVSQACDIRARVADGNFPAAQAWLPQAARRFGGRHGLVVLDAEGQVLLANAEASRILARGDPLQLARNRLTAADPALRQHLERARVESLGTVDGQAADTPPILRVPRPGARLGYEVQVLPAAGREMMPPGAATVVVLTDPEAVLGLAAGRLQALGLTAAEARLCDALVRTGALPRAAAELGIAHGTARSHLKAIFGKLGVSTQIELVQVLVAGAGADFGDS
jgi:DNA-binding CsgD family transcriptional regulator